MCGAARGARDAHRDNVEVHGRQHFHRHPNRHVLQACVVGRDQKVTDHVRATHPGAVATGVAGNEALQTLVSWLLPTYLTDG